MKIFVSSTVKDLEYLRDELYRRLKELGHTPWLSEKGDFPLNRHPDAMTNCLVVAEECDLFIVLLDKRAGLPYQSREGSPYQDLFGLTISEAEYRCARKKGKPVCIFIRKRAKHESAIYRKMNEEQRKSFKGWYSDPGVYEFYDRLMHEKPHIPWIHPFEFINEIMEPLNTIIGEVQAPPQSGTCVKFTCISREAEHVKEVYVAGEFNDWLGATGGLIRPSPKEQERYGLQRQIKEGKEIWEKDIYVSPGHYDFKFVVGKRHWIHWYEDSGYTRGNDAPGGPNFRIQVSIDSGGVVIISEKDVPDKFSLQEIPTCEVHDRLADLKTELKSFVGREDIIRNIVDSKQNIVIFGPPGIGKSFLLAKIASDYNYVFYQFSGNEDYVRALVNIEKLACAKTNAKQQIKYRDTAQQVFISSMSNLKIPLVLDQFERAPKKFYNLIEFLPVKVIIGSRDKNIKNTIPLLLNELEKEEVKILLEELSPTDDVFEAIYDKLKGYPYYYRSLKAYLEINGIKKLDIIPELPKNIEEWNNWLWNELGTNDFRHKIIGWLAIFREDASNEMLCMAMGIKFSEIFRIDNEINKLKPFLIGRKLFHPEFEKFVSAKSKVLHEKAAEIESKHASFHYYEAGNIDKFLENVELTFENKVRVGRWKDAKWDLEHAIKILENKDFGKTSTYLHRLSRIYRGTGDNKEAVKNHLKAIEMSQKSKDAGRIYITISNIEGFLLYQIPTTELLKICSDCLHICENQGKLIETAGILRTIGKIYGKIGNYGEALSNFNRCLEICKQDEKLTIKEKGFCLIDMATVHRRMGEWEESIARQEEAIRLGRGNLNFLAETYIMMGEYKRAIETIEEDLRQNHDRVDIYGLRHILSTAGFAYFLHNKLDIAGEKYNEIIEITTKAGFNLGKIEGLVGLGEIFISQNKLDDAFKLLEEAVKISKEVGEKKYFIWDLDSSPSMSLGRFWLTKYIISNSDSYLDKALEYAKESERILTEINSFRLGEAKILLAQIYLEKGKLVQDIKFKKKLSDESFNWINQAQQFYKNKKTLFKANEQNIIVYELNKLKESLSIIPD